MIFKFLSKEVLEAAADRTRLEAYGAGVEDRYPLSVDNIAEFYLEYDLFYGADLPARVDGSTDPAARLISVGQHVLHDGRRRFTVAHEIGHIVLHLPALTAQASHQAALFTVPQAPVQDERLEFQANYFAAALLMPRAPLTTAFGGQVAQQEYVPADEVAHYFGVSIQAAALRMKQLGLMRATSPGEPLDFKAYS